MGGFSSTIPSGGGDQQSYDPAKYINRTGTAGESGDGMEAAGASTQSPSADFVQSMGRIGMDLQNQIQTLAGQHPEAADDFRVATQALKKAMAKILTTNSRAMEPMSPRQV